MKNLPKLIGSRFSVLGSEVQRFRVLGSAFWVQRFKGSGFWVQRSKKDFNPSTLNGERRTFEPISLQSFNLEREAENL
jgi:hypothetical protein